MAYQNRSKKQKKSRQELNDEGRLLKKKRKHKGLPSGSRQGDDNTQQNGHRSGQNSDPRIGSKKPIPLVATQPQSKAPTRKTVPSKPSNALSPEQELAQLENDEQLEQFLIRLEEGERLSAKEQDYVDNTLDRIAALMDQLGLVYDDDGDDDKPQDDIMKLLKQ